jgi:hypothetical protein
MASPITRDDISTFKPSSNNILSLLIYIPLKPSPTSPITNSKQITQHTLQSVQSHQLVIDSVCDEINDAKEQTLKLIITMDEISHDMEGVHALAAQM